MARAENISSRLYALIASTRFPLVSDADAMKRWIGFVRIAVGVIAFIRWAIIAESSRFYYRGGDSWTGLVNAHETELALFILALLALFIVGFATPLVTLVLLATMQNVDQALGTQTLGTYVLTLMLAFMLLAGVGSHLSVDARLGRRMRWLYVLGGPDARQLTIYLFGLFVGYGLISFAALLHHMTDPYWQGGYTVGVLLSSQYLSRLYEPARALQEFWPWGMQAFSRISVIGQTVFQFGMLVLIKWRWGLWYVIAWGGMFILISVVAIMLSYLPYVEVCLWALLWVRPRKKAAVEVLYDDRCNLCRGTVRFLRVLDPLKAFAFLPLSSNEAFATEHGATSEAVLEDLHGVRRGKLLRGYALYRVLVRANPLLWIFVPLLELGQLTRIGPAVYGFVARRRRRLFGTCELGGAPEPEDAVPTPPQRAVVLTSATGFLTVVAISMMMATPELYGLFRSLWLRPWPDPVERVARETRATLGFVRPDVFNSMDLKMGERWWTATWEAPDGRRGTVPFNDDNGDRGPYHISDSLYFGNSLVWHRGSITNDVIEANQPGGKLRTYLDRVLRYHRRREGGPGPFRYHVRIWADRTADVTLTPEERWQKIFMTEFDTEVG